MSPKDINIDDLKKLVSILDNNLADDLRELYIEQFVNTSSEHFTKYIQPLKEFSDGFCYEGYLWDCLINPVRITEKNLKERLLDFNPVYVFWDIHSKDKIFIEDYWKFGKKTVLKLTSSDLLIGLNQLPEDIYIFDDSLDWTLVLTHESDRKRRFCFMSGVKAYNKQLNPTASPSWDNLLFKIQWLHSANLFKIVLVK